MGAETIRWYSFSGLKDFKQLTVIELCTDGHSHTDGPVTYVCGNSVSGCIACTDCMEIVCKTVLYK